MLYILSVLALLASCMAFSLSLALMFRVKKTIGVAPDSSLIRSASVAPVNPGTRIADYPDLVDVNGSKFSLPSDAPEPWVLAFHSLQCGGASNSCPAIGNFLSSRGFRESVLSP